MWLLGAIVTALGGVRSGAQTTTNVWLNTVSGFWHEPLNWSLGYAPHLSNAFVAITNFNSKVILANETTPASNLVLRTLVIGALQNRQNTLVLSNLAAPFQVTRGLTMLSGAGLQVFGSTVVVDGTLGGQMGLTLAQAAVTGGAIHLTNGALFKIGNGTGASGLAVTNAVVTTDSELRVGALNRSAGRLALAGGSSLTIGTELYVADEAGSTGAVVMVGGLLRATNALANTRIGQRGTGSFTQSGGVVELDDVSVGRHDTARGLLQLQGGDFTCGTLSLGRFSNSVGVATFSGGRLNVANGSLYVGREGSGLLTNLGGTITASRLIVPGATNAASGHARFSGGAAVFTGGLVLGSGVSSGQVTVDGGLLACTNSTGTATSVLTSGTFSLSAGQARFDRLIVTNAAAQVLLQGGVLSAREIIFRTGAPFVVGDGVQPAVLELRGGTAVFEDGLILSAQATLSGCGTVNGAVTVQAGGANALGSCPGGGPQPVLLTGLELLPGGLQFSFEGADGATYTVEFTDDLGAPAWQPVLGAQIAAGPGLTRIVTLPDAGAGLTAGCRVFRVRTNP